MRYTTFLLAAVVSLTSSIAAMAQENALNRDRGPSKPQLYIYDDTRFIKKGYIQAAAEDEGKVAFQICDDPKPVTIEKVKLKPAEGDCKNSDVDRGTWVATFTKGPGGSIVLQTSNESIVYSKSQWDLLVGDSEGLNLKNGSFVGMTTYGSAKSIFPVAPNLEALDERGRTG